MKYIIPEFEAVIGKTCILTALYNITLYNKCKYLETDLFFLCNDLNVEYKLDLNDIASRPMLNLPNLEKEAIINVKMFDNDRSLEFSEKVYNVLTGNNLVILFVNTSCLTYNRVYQENDNRYHAILLYGIDVENDLAYIADPHVREYTGDTSKFQGPVSLKEISGAAYRIAWFDFQNKKDLGKVEIFKVAHANFSKFLKGEVIDGKTFYGIAALKRYIGDLNKLLFLDDKQLEETCINMNYLIKICSFNYINTYLISFIKENAPLEDFNTAEVLHNCEAISQEWITAGLSILRLGKSLKKDRVYKIIEKCEVLLEIQTEVYYEFMELLKYMNSLEEYTPQTPHAIESSALI